MSEPWRYRLSSSDVEAIDGAIESCLAPEDGIDDEALRRIAMTAPELPRALRQLCYDFRVMEPDCGALVISGLPVDDEGLGPTPSHWLTANSRARREQCYLSLVASLVGDPMAWATQQDGRIIHHVFPIREHEHEQLGTGSRELLWWHTEDAFHPLRPDYVGLFCLRNPDRTPTTLASLERLPLADRDVDRLFKPHFTIRPDNSHQATNQGDQGRGVSYDHIEAMNANPDRIPVLSGDRASPYLRLDPYFMDQAATEPEAQRALESLIAHIDSRLSDLVLQPGDVCLIDNYKAVHGRRAFAARYDGTDRWLLRINVTRDLRKSRHCRPSARSRVLH